MQSKKIVLMLSFALGLILFAGLCSADVQRSKLGNEFISTTGSYLSVGHCSSAEGTCGWVSGTDVIVGAYYSRPNTWGGSMTWNFDLSQIDLSGVDRVEVKVSWAPYYNKGLHGPTTTGQAYVNVNGNNIASLITNGTKVGNDYYAHNPSIYYLTFPFSAGFLSNTTSLILGTGVNTLWDVREVKLYLYESNKTVRIINGKFVVNNTNFLVKGIVYSPWIPGTGPSPDQAPFPDENEDVTVRFILVRDLPIPDYNGNRKVDAWEVIQYDLEKIKAAGVNTIRTYSSGVWHDRNMNGILDSNETVQGDMPDWFYDRVFAFARANNMKVILGYWVEEEDRVGPPYFCNFSDLEVAKRTLGRVVNKYKNNSALLAWGIGNEVKLGQNHAWFNWSVDSNEYINRLNDYVRTLDNNHPIIYARYVGEQANFDSINSEVIAVNAYINNASYLRSNEFITPAPSGRAYMLGEYAHLLSQADEHWDLADDYAGGGFLEFNDVWWKGVGSYFGIVNEDRKIVPERFSKVLYLYTGQSAACYNNAQCGTNNWTGNAFCNASNNKQVLINYTSYQCNDAGAANSSCSSSMGARLNQTCAANEICNAGACIPFSVACYNNSQCGTDGFVGNPFCSATNSSQVLKNYMTFTCSNPGTVNSSCLNQTTPNLFNSCTTNQVCSSGSCLNVACSSNSQCGTNGWTGNAFCNGKDVWKNWTTFTCNSPGTVNSTCSRRDDARLSQTCNFGCSNGSCVVSFNSTFTTFYEPFDNLTGIPERNGVIMYRNISLFALGSGTAANLSNGAYIQYPVGGNFPSSLPASIEFWFKPSNRSSYGLFGIDELRGIPNTLGIFSNYQVIYIEMANATQGLRISSTDRVQNTSWNHIALVFENTTDGCYNAVIYLNGLRQPSYFWASSKICGYAPLNNQTMYVGYSGWYGSSFSLVDEYRVVNYTLSASEIASDYAKMLNETGQSPVNATCSVASDCGTNNWTGSTFCNPVYPKWLLRNYTYYSCISPGVASSYCTNSSYSNLYMECASNQFCGSGSCVNATCGSNSQCGTNGWTGNAFCNGKDVWMNWTTFTCNGPGTANSTCSRRDDARLSQTCNFGCSNGSCVVSFNSTFTTFYEPFDNLTGIPERNGVIVYRNISLFSLGSGTAANLSNGAYIQYPVGGNFPSSLPASIEFWFKPSNRSFYGLFGIDVLQGRPNTLGIFSNYQVIYIEMKNATQGLQISSTDRVQNTSWNHVALTFNLSVNGCYSPIIYLNGARQSLSYSTICGYAPLNNQTMYVGYSGWYGSSSSLVDEYRVVNYTLSASEIASDYAKMLNETGQSPVNITCSVASDCGINNWTGSQWCNPSYSRGILRNYTYYSCILPGMASSYCTNYTSFRDYGTCGPYQFCSLGSCVNATCSRNSDCGTDGFVGSAYCSGNSVWSDYATYTCNNAGTANSSCSSNLSVRLKRACNANEVCDAGACVPLFVACYNNSQCGTDGFVGNPFCSATNSSQVLKNYMTFTCSNPGTVNSSCLNQTTQNLFNSCTTNQVCNAGVCVANPTCRSLGDLNNDCVINAIDLGIVRSNFGMEGAGLAGDVNNDGFVNAIDLQFPITNFGKSCAC